MRHWKVVILIAVLWVIGVVALMVFGSPVSVGRQASSPQTLPIVVEGEGPEIAAITDILNANPIIVDPETGVKFALQIVKPNPNMDYKILQVKPDPETDYIIHILEPDMSLHSRAPEPDTSRYSPEFDPQIARAIADLMKKREEA